MDCQQTKAESSRKGRDLFRGWRSICVSAGRQAEQELSIPDQKAQTRAWAAQRGWTVVPEHVEPDTSATDDKRPEFQRMIERACDGENAFDVIVVHSDGLPRAVQAHGQARPAAHAANGRPAPGT
jgi:hypothetical protein